MVPFERKRVIVSVTAAGLDGALVRGSRILRTDREPLPFGAWHRAWSDGFIGLDRPLHALLARIAPGGRPPVEFCFDAQSVFCDATEIPARDDAAVQAAALQARERLGGTGIFAIRTLDEASSEASTMVLTAGVGDQEAAILFAWVARGGGELVRLVPTRAHEVELIARLGHPGRTEAVCYLGAHSTAIAIMSEGVPTLLRSVSLGYTNLAEGYARGLGVRPSASDGSDHETTGAWQAAIERMFQAGLPTLAHLAHDCEMSSTHRSVMPLLAPVLQRYTIELKQTLRFGTTPGDDESTPIRLVGPGAAIPGIEETFTFGLDRSVEVDPALRCPDPLEPFGAHTSEHAIVTGAREPIALTPPIIQERRRSRTLRQALVVGAGAGLVFLGAEFTAVKMEQRGVEAVEGDLAPILAGLKAERERHRTLAELAQAITDVERVTDWCLPDRPSWEACVLEIALACRGEVELLRVEGEASAGAAELIIDGRVANDAGSAARVSKFMARLERSPLVARSHIESAAAGDERGAPYRDFTISATLVESRDPARRVEISETGP